MGMKSAILKCLPLVDVLLAPSVYPCAWLLKMVRRIGTHRLPMCRGALLRVGVFPIRDHYYEPQFKYGEAEQAALEARRDRALAGIRWNTQGQLAMLAGFSCSHELVELLSQDGAGDLHFRFGNGTFESGDAEYWYQLIRRVKPRRIFEIGSGNSTLMARHAIEKNRRENPQYQCKHLCVEPYEMPWLESAGVTVLRKKIEDVGVELFSELEDGDLLFIDSSHMIRPRGDVVFEYLELLPRLSKGVIVHVHDIFSPKNYSTQWLRAEVRFWNEQYLLEAFLSHNSSWEIVGALSYLHHNHFEQLKAVAPFLTPERNPGSFYIRKTAD